MKRLLKWGLLVLLVGGCWYLATAGLQNLATRAMPLIGDELLAVGLKPADVQFERVLLRPTGVRWRKISTELVPVEIVSPAAYDLAADALELHVADFSFKRYLLKATAMRLSPSSDEERQRRPVLTADELRCAATLSPTQGGWRTLLSCIAAVRALALTGRADVQVSFSGELRFASAQGERVLPVEAVAVDGGSKLKATVEAVRTAAGAAAAALSAKQLERIAEEPTAFAEIM